MYEKIGDAIIFNNQDKPKAKYYSWEQAIPSASFQITNMLTRTFNGKYGTIINLSRTVSQLAVIQ